VKISVLLSIAWDLYIFLLFFGFVQEKEKLYLSTTAATTTGVVVVVGGLLDCQSIRLVDMEGIGAYPLRVSERNRPAALCCVVSYSCVAPLLYVV
jgi:hypothetical protein